MTWTFPFISCTSTDPCISHTCYPPIPPVTLHVPYLLKLPPCLLVFTSLVLYSTWGCLSITNLGIGHRILFDTPELSSGLSLEQMVGFSLVHS